MNGFWGKYIQPIKLIFLLFLLLGAFSFAMFQGGFVSWFLFYSFCPLAIYGIAIYFYPLKKAAVERRAEKKALFAGEELKVKGRIKRKGFFPLFYLIVEDKVAGGRDQTVVRTEKMMLFPYFKRVIDFEYAVGSLPRGVHYLNEVELAAGDPLGFIEKRAAIPAAKEKLIVFPEYEHIPFSSLTSFSYGGMASANEKMEKDTTMAASVREYQYGDRFSWINWKASAKRNELMTKEFEQRMSSEISIMVDCYPDDQFEAIVSFAASIVISCIRNRGKAQLFFSDPAEKPIFIKGTMTQHEALYRLALIEDQCPAPIADILAGERKRTERNGFAMLITRHLSSRLIENAAFAGIKAIFAVKLENEKVTDEELLLQYMAGKRGIAVRFPRSGQFSHAFSGVANG